MSDYLDLADEIEKLPANTAIRFAPRAQRVIVSALKMVADVDAMMAYLGHYGEISPKSELADAVMKRLQEIGPK